MKVIFRTIYLLISILLINSTQAQEGSVSIYDEGDQVWGINYSVGFPTGEFRDFIDKTSWRGFNLEYDIFIVDNLSIGFSAGYRLFHQIEDRETYEIEQGNAGISVNAKIWKYTHVVPLQANMRYYYAPSFDSWVYLYGGLGLGTAYVNEELWIGLSTIQDDDWRFIASPEFGMEITTGGFSNILIGGQYQYILNGHRDEEPLTNWNLKVGFRKWIQ